MKLSAKMAWGFGSLVVVAGVLGVVSWFGVSSISATVAVDKHGNECLESLNRCAALRRDFTANGFKKAEGETQDAAEKWTDAFGTLRTQLEGLSAAADLTAENRESVHGVLAKTDDYKKAFGQQMEARKSKDDARAAWTKLGGAVTEEIDTTLKNVINPARQTAEQSKNVDDILRWSRVADSLNQQVIQTFLLLRVNGVYLIATNADEQWERFQKQVQTTKQGLGSWTELAKGESQLEAVAARLKQYFTEYETAAEQYHSGILAERSADQAMASTAKEIVAGMGALRTALQQRLDSNTTRIRTLSVAVTVGAMFLGVVMAIMITRSITKPINRIIAGLNEGADQVNDAAGQVSSASQQLAEGASEQASSLEETSSALEQMAAMTRTNAENAKQANGLSVQARTAADAGDKTMQRLNQAMTAINDSSGKISKIIKVIEEIAFQTNLLALNAAVEAARAGEHGKGFAVVADEVRNLAQRAAQAARETTALIEDSVSKAKEGTDVAAEVGKALGTIVGDVTKVTELINGIAQASQEQAQGVEQVNTAVSQMDKVTQQNAAGAEESASAAEELSAQAQCVKGMVNELVVLVEGKEREETTASRPTAPTKSANKSPKPKVLATVSKASPSKPSPNPGPDHDAKSGSDDFMSLDTNLSDF